MVRLQRLKGSKYLAIDTETTGLEIGDDLLSLQIGNDDIQIIIYPADLMKENVFSFIKDLLASEEILKIFHNSVFDICVLKSVGFKDIKCIFDTMVVEQLLTAGYPIPKGFYRLDNLVNRYLKISIDKSMQKSFIGMKVGDKFSKEQEEYAKEDIKHLINIMKIQHNRMYLQGMALKDSQNIYTVLGLENNTCIALAEMRFQGVKLNLKTIEKIKKLVIIDLNKVLDDLNFIALKEFNVQNINWNSHVQKLSLLKQIVPEIESTGKEILLDYKDSHPIFQLLIDYSGLSKLLNSFLTKLPKHINNYTGKIHPNFKQVLKTGRIAAFNPNIMQIPSNGKYASLIRSCFVADEGWSIIGADYSQAELRIIAAESGDKQWIDIINNNLDLHGELAAKTFNIPIENVRDVTDFNNKITYRYVQKRINFGLAYGMSAMKLANIIKVEISEAQEIIDKFFEIVPDVKNYLDKIGKQGALKGYCETPKPYRRKRYFIKDGTVSQGNMLIRQSKNMPAQGGNADLIKLAIVCIDKTIKKHNYPVKLLFTVHDEIQTMVKDEFAEEWAKILKNIMVLCGSVITKHVKMDCDVSISKHWVK